MYVVVALSIMGWCDGKILIVSSKKVKLKVQVKFASVMVLLNKHIFLFEYNFIKHMHISRLLL